MHISLRHGGKLSTYITSIFVRYINVTFGVRFLLKEGRKAVRG